MTSNRHPTYHSTWQMHLEPTLVRRLHRPLKQPGITNHQMANGLIERSQRLLKRLPLLEQQMHRWSSIVDLEAEQAPIVYTHLQAQENNTEAPIASVSSAYALNLAQEQQLPLTNRQLPQEQTQSRTVERSRSQQLTTTPANALVNPASNDSATERSALNVVQMSKSTLASTQSISTQPISTQSKLPFTTVPEVNGKPAIAVTSDQSDMADGLKAAVIAVPQLLPVVQATRDRPLPSTDVSSVRDRPPVISEPSTSTTVLPSINPIPNAVIQRKQDNTSTAPVSPSSQTFNPSDVAAMDSLHPLPFLETQGASKIPTTIAPELTAQPDPIVIKETAAIATLSPLPVVQARLNTLPSSGVSNVNDNISSVADASTSTAPTPAISPIPHAVIQLKQDNASIAPAMPLPQAFNTSSVAETDAFEPMPLLETQGTSTIPTTIAPELTAQPDPIVITETAAIAALSPLPIVQATSNPLPSTEGLSFKDDISSVGKPLAETTAAPSISPIPSTVIQLKQDNASTAPAMPLSQALNTSGVAAMDAVEPMPFLEMQGASTIPTTIALEAMSKPDSIVMETAAIAALSPLPMVQTTPNALPSTEGLSVKDKLPIVAGRSPTHDFTSTPAKTVVIQPQHNAALDASKPLTIAPNSPEIMPLLKNLNINELLTTERGIERGIEKQPSSPLDAQLEQLPTVHIALELASPQFEPLILSHPDRAKSKAKSPDDNLLSPKPSSSKVDTISTANHNNASSPQQQNFPASNVAPNPLVGQSVSSLASLSNPSRNRVDSGSQSAAAIAPLPIDLDALADKVERQLMRRLVVEGERRGKKKWH